MVDEMPRITVKYLMSFSQVTGTQRESLEVSEGDTVSDLLKLLYARYGSRFRKLVEQDLENRSVIFVINGESCERSTVLKDRDEVLISYPVGGG